MRLILCICTLTLLPVAARAANIDLTCFEVSMSSPLFFNTGGVTSTEGTTERCRSR